MMATRQPPRSMSVRADVRVPVSPPAACWPFARSPLCSAGCCFANSSPAERQGGPGWVARAGLPQLRLPGCPLVVHGGRECGCLSASLLGCPVSRPRLRQRNRRILGPSGAVGNGSHGRCISTRSPVMIHQWAWLGLPPAGPPYLACRRSLGNTCDSTHSPASPLALSPVGSPPAAPGTTACQLPACRVWSATGRQKALRRAPRPCSGARARRHHSEQDGAGSPSHSNDVE